MSFFYEHTRNNKNTFYIFTTHKEKSVQPSSYDVYNYLDRQVVGSTFLFIVDGNTLLSEIALSVLFRLNMIFYLWPK